MDTRENLIASKDPNALLDQPKAETAKRLGKWHYCPFRNKNHKAISCGNLSKKKSQYAQYLHLSSIHAKNELNIPNIFETPKLMEMDIQSELRRAKKLLLN